MNVVSRSWRLLRFGTRFGSGFGVHLSAGLRLLRLVSTSAHYSSAGGSAESIVRMS